VSLGAAKHPGHNLAIGDARVRLQRAPRARAPLGERLVNMQGDVRGAKRIIVMGHGRAEQRHHGVANVVVDSAAIVADQIVDELGIAAHQVTNARAYCPSPNASSRVRRSMPRL
jgi:hypothetical protein